MILSQSERSGALSGSLEIALARRFLQRAGMAAHPTLD